jgi:endonuclease-3 related protein
VSDGRLAELIRPAGYFNVKTRRLKNFVEWLWTKHDGKFEKLAKLPMERLRSELLSVNGVGPETADSIVLYALDRATFVVDAYTGRIVRRHRLLDADAGYDEIKSLFEENQPRSAKRYNEYHALIVAVGKRHCGPTPRCGGCPLEGHAHDESL